MLRPDGSESPIEVLRDIIVNQMGLDDDRVALYNQKWDIPNDNGICVVIEYRFAKTVANNLYYANSAGNFQTEARMLAAEHVTIGIFSRGLDALRRKEEVVMAIWSDYARQKMDEYSFKIMGKCAPIKDLSYVEGAARIYRFDIDLVLLTKYTLVITPPYYTKFPTELDFEQAILQQTFQLGG